jgi:hypothetical protein
MYEVRDMHSCRRGTCTLVANENLWDAAKRVTNETGDTSGTSGRPAGGARVQGDQRRGLNAGGWSRLGESNRNFSFWGGLCVSDAASACRPVPNLPTFMAILATAALHDTSQP